MNTRIRYPSTDEFVRQETTPMIENALGGQVLESEIPHAINAVVSAFFHANHHAGKGHEGHSSGVYGAFYATASVDYGDFNLYRKLI